jgi:DNA modification methylase
MNSVLTKISAIKRNPNNPRILKDDKFAKLTQSIKDFPQMLEIRPIVVNDDMVVLGGNMRLKACKEAGLKEVPVIKVNDLTEEQQREFIIKDNVGFGEWDWDLLANEWDTDLLEDWGLELDFNPEDDDNAGLTDEDDTPEVTENPVSKVGDIWLLGEHRVMCGDSVSVKDVGLLMNGETADMCFTDPPYLMDFTGGIHADGSKSFNAKHGEILNDKMSKQDGENFLDDINLTIKNNVSGAFYITFYRLGIDGYFNSLERVGLKYRSLIIWNKGNHTLSNSDYMSMYEPIFYGWVNDHKFYGGNNGMDIWDIKRTKKNDLHPTMKPVELIEKALDGGSKKDDLILDIFLGSGSTLIGCEKKGRKCYGMELDPKYVDVIVKRWQDYTGKKAIHAESGDEFVEVDNGKI